MSTKKEKLVQQIREVRKEKANKLCFDCGEKGPQYVCLPFSTFVCMTCSGLHREFNHRVKSISISDFTEEEVNGIKNGGNEVAQRKWMARYDPKDFPIPDPSQPSVIRTQRLKELIKLKYIDKRWAERDEKKKKKEDKEKEKKKVTKETKPKKAKKVVPKEEDDEEEGPGSPKAVGRSVTLPPMVVQPTDDEDEPPKKVKSKAKPVQTGGESKSKAKPKKAVQDSQPKEVEAEEDEEVSPRAQPPKPSQPQPKPSQPQPQQPQPAGSDPLDLLSFSSDEVVVTAPSTNGTKEKEGEDWADFDGPQSSAPPPKAYTQPPSIISDQWGFPVQAPRPQPAFIDFTVKSSVPPVTVSVEKKAEPIVTPPAPTPQPTGDLFADLMASPPTTQAPPPLGIPSGQTAPPVSSVPVSSSVPISTSVPTMPPTLTGIPQTVQPPYGVPGMMTPGVGLGVPQWGQQTTPQWSQQAAYQAALAYQQQMMYYYMAQQHAAAQAAQQTGGTTSTTPPQSTSNVTPTPVPRNNSFEDIFQ